MVEDSFLYCITLFTFAVVFGLCYVRRVMTFFERKRISLASVPGFPLGNVSNVVFGKVSLAMQLWKYHNRFKKKNVKFGGLYLFLKPAVVVVDQRLIERVLAIKDHTPQTLTREHESSIQEKFSNLGVTKKIPSNEGEVDLAAVLKSCILDVTKTKIVDGVLLEFPESPTGLQEVVSIVLPPLSSLFSSVARWNSLIQKEILNRKKNDIRREDVLQVLINAGLSSEEAIGVVTSILKNLRLATNLVALCLYELSINEEIQEDLQGEILRFLKQGGGRADSSVDSLEFLETVVRETFRKYPPKPFVLKPCLRDLKTTCGDIPEDVLIFVSVFGIHHDAKNYTNPELFDPDRFSEENERFVDQKKFLPFGSQKDNTFELRFTSFVVKQLLLELLSKFRFDLGKRSMKSLKLDETTSELRPKDGMWLKVDAL